jgi:hypothetical protein
LLVRERNDRDMRISIQPLHEPAARQSDFLAKPTAKTTKSLQKGEQANSLRIKSRRV